MQGAPPIMTRTNRPVWLSRQDAADELGLSVKTIGRRIADGTLPAYRVGPHQVRIKGSDLDKIGRRIPVMVTR